MARLTDSLIKDKLNLPRLGIFGLIAGFLLTMAAPAFGEEVAPVAKKTKPTVKKSTATFKMSLEFKLGVQKSKTKTPEPDLESSADRDEVPGVKPPQKASQAFWNIAFQPQKAWILSSRFTLFPDKATNLLDVGVLKYRSKQTVLQESDPRAASSATGLGWSVSLGRDVLRLGGFENQTLTLSPVPLSSYQEYRLPFRDQTDRRTVDGLVLASGGVFGKVDMQLLKDVRSTTYDNDRKEFSYGYTDSKSKKMAGAIQWIYRLTLADWGFSPLVQASRYDAMKSTYLGGGFKVDHPIVVVSVDVAQDKRAIKSDLAEAQDEQEETQFVQTRFGTVQGQLLLGDWQPFVKGSQFTTVQPKLDQLGNTDTTTFDDQSLDGYLGASWNRYKVKPYGWVQWQKQKVIDQPRNPFVSSAVVTQTYELGVFGEI